MKKLNPFRLTKERIPSVKTLRQITCRCAVDNAVLMRKVLEHGDRHELACFVDDPVLFPKTQRWLRGQHSDPSLVETKLEAADELLEGFGVECAGEVDMRDGPPLEYVNMGDTYDLTLCRFNGSWRVCSMGDIVERHERLFRDR